jgi:hypothetical protein
MIYVYPIGGLGNMMFHIASIWSLAKDNNDELGLLNIPQKIASLVNDPRYYHNECNLRHAQKYEYIFNRFPQINGRNFPTFSYPFTYTPLKYQKEYQYMGYYQSEKYFKHRRNEILELFKPTDEINIGVMKYSDLFDNISLHVRRGPEIVSCTDVYTLPTMEYYNNALSCLPQDLKILIFSDNMKWCKENFIGNRFVFIKEIDYISIYLMSKMKYHIVANSTFSWWGAWMSNAEKIFSPRSWFVNGSGVSDVDLIPENWIKI